MAARADGAPLEVLVLAPTGRDAPLMVEALDVARIVARRVSSTVDLIEAVAAEVDGAAAPRLGAVVATDDALGVDWAVRLASVLDRQPSWSDLPLVLLASSGGAAGERRWAGPRSPAAVAERLTERGSVTVLDRPVRVATLVSAVRAALRARARQAEVRALIASRDRALAEAERASRAKSDFLAMMSHELRTPLNAIAGYVDLLLMGVRGPLPDEQRDYLERVGRSQRHLLGIINDILNFARVESGRVEYDIVVVPISDVIAEVTPMIEPQLAAKGLALDTRIAGADAYALADREKLRQVLLNLLSNAVKFTPAGGRITIAVESGGANAAAPVRIAVRDTGIGIPADKLEAVFEPFVQVRAEPTTRREGTGLGLAISRDLTRGMGGDLTVESEVGRGSSFTITLRRVNAGAANGAVEDVKAPARAVPAAPRPQGNDRAVAPPP